jgi:hypothetical protein
MKQFTRFTVASAAALAFISFNTLPGNAEPAKGHDAAAPAAAASTNSAAEIPLSVFVVPTSPTEGKNPFYPRSTMGMELPKVPKIAPVMDTSALVLNGITSKPKPSVMINSRTFEPGEEGEVKLPAGGKMLVRVEEIHEDGVVVLVNGNLRRELHLRNGI